MNTPPSLETRLFRAINGVAEPAIRAGFGSPCLWPTGLIVLETTGRRSGRPFRVPVAVSLWGRMIIASTVRGSSSQWLKNVAATPTLRYWLAGREHEADAIVFSPGVPLPDVDAMPVLLRPLVPGLSMLSALGMGFAVLIPHEKTS